MHASMGVSRAPKATTAPRHQHTTDEFCVGDSGASENGTTDVTFFENRELAHPGDRAESTDDEHLPMAGYGRLRLLVDREGGTFRGETLQLMRERSPTCSTWGITGSSRRNFWQNRWTR